jgi:hypothetical protein
MATVDKIKIADLEIGYKDVLEAQADLKERIRELNEETKLLEATQEVLRQGNRKDTDQYKQNAKAIEANKTAVSGLQTEYKNNQRVLEGVISTKNTELGTIQKLDAENKKLRASLRNLDLTTKDGQKTQKEYIAQINKNTEFIRQNSDAAIQQKMTIGAYKTVFDALPPSLQAGARGFQGMTTAAKAFLANPVVLAIVAIVGAVAGLVKAFKSTEEGGDRLKKRFDQLKAVISVVTDRIENFAIGLAKVFSGEKKLKDLKGTFAGMGDEMEREVRLAGQLRDMLESLENKEIDMLVVSASRRTEINRLREAAADQNKTEAERITLMQRANRLIEEEAKAQQDVLLTKIANELGTTDLVKVQERLNQVRNEGKQITLEEIGLSNSTNEDRRRVNELIAQYIDLEGQAAMQKKEMASQISGLLKKEMTDREKQLMEENEVTRKYYEEQYKAAEAEMLAEVELERKRIEQEEALRNAEIEKQKQWDADLAAVRAEKAFIDADNRRIAREVEMNDRFQAELDLLAREQEAEIQSALKTGASVGLIMKKYTAIEKQVEFEKQKAKLDIVSGFVGAIGGLFDQETRLGKAAAIVQTVINTYKGAMSAFAETPGGIVIKLAAASTAVGTGIAAVKNIVKAGKGGSGGADTSISAAGIAGTGSGSSQATVLPPSTYVTSISQQQTVLVIEEFQRVNQRQIQVKQAGEL